MLPAIQNIKSFNSTTTGEFFQVIKYSLINFSSALETCMILHAEILPQWPETNSLLRFNRMYIFQ